LETESINEATETVTTQPPSTEAAAVTSQTPQLPLEDVAPVLMVSLTRWRRCGPTGSDAGPGVKDGER
jgi:hypothetical protein